MLVIELLELGEEVSALDENVFLSDRGASTLDAVGTSGVALGEEVSTLDELLLSSRVESDSGDAEPSLGIDLVVLEELQVSV